MKVKAVLLAAGLAASATCAHADPLKDAIDARRGYFDLVALNFGGVVAMAKGEAPYSPDEARVFTQNLVALANMSLAPALPEGSDNEAMFGETRALPAIWSNFNGFAAKAGDFQQAAAALDAAAGESLDALRAQVGQVGATCKGCHDDYRAKEF